MTLALTREVHVCFTGLQEQRCGPIVHYDYMTLQRTELEPKSDHDWITEVNVEVLVWLKLGVEKFH